MCVGKNRRYYNRRNNRFKKNATEDSKYTYVPVYSKDDKEKDERKFSKSERDGKIDWSSFQRLMLHDICCNTNIIESGYLDNISLDDIDCAFQNPRRGWRMLLAASNKLMHISPHYYRLNKLYGNMALFCWGIDLYDVKDNANISVLKKTYGNLAAKLESMNLKHEFSKIMGILPYQDVYCGLIVESQNDFFIQKIDFRICKLYEVQDGLFNFIINLSSISPLKLGAYPDYVQQAWMDYKDGKLASNWYYPPADKQICIKLNYQWNYPYPFLISLVKDLLDLDVYKKLKLQSARTDNYKAILMKVPIDEKYVDKPLLTPKTLATFAEINNESTTDDIGFLYTLGTEGKAISFKDSSNTRNNVSDAIDEVYNSSGVTEELFNGSSSGTAVTFSVENDSAFVYTAYRQFERWVNRFIKLRKYNKSTFKFSFYLLDITIFNRDNVTKRYKEAISFGATVIDKYLASIDMSPSRILGSFRTHQDIYNFGENFIPLQTSYTSSSTTPSEDSAGRPKNSDKGELLDVAGEQTEDSDANKNR